MIPTVLQEKMIHVDIIKTATSYLFVCTLANRSFILAEINQVEFIGQTQHFMAKVQGVLHFTDMHFLPQFTPLRGYITLDRQGHVQKARLHIQDSILEAIR